MFMYALFVFTILSNSKYIMKLPPSYLTVIIFTIIVLMTISIVKNKEYIEKFEADDISSDSNNSLVGQSNNTVSTQRSNTTIDSMKDEIVVNEDHNDYLLSESGIKSYQCIFYLSSYQYKSVDFTNNTWSSLTNSSDKIKLKKIDNLYTIYTQLTGFNLSNGVHMEGFKSDALKMGYYRMKQFTFFMHMNLNKTLEKSVNLFELYSSNVKGNIAFNVIVNPQYKMTIMYGGISINEASAIDISEYNGKNIFLTIVKAHLNNTTHTVKVYINDKLVTTIDNIEYNKIEYASGNRDYIELSKEKFLINKPSFSLSDQENDDVSLHVHNIGMLNVSIDEEKVQKMYNNLYNQLTVQLNPTNVLLTKEKTAANLQIQEYQRQIDQFNSCKLSPEVCGQCIGVDTNKLAAIKSSPQCYNAFNVKCEFIEKTPNGNHNQEEVELCEFIRPIIIQTNSNCVRDNSSISTDLKNIELDNLSRTNDHVNVDGVQPITVSSLSEPRQTTPSEETELSSSSNEESPPDNRVSLREILNQNMSQEQIYKNILSDYQKELDDKINTDSDNKENWLVDFMKYFFFIK